MVVSVVYLPRVYITHYYHGVIVIKKNSRIKPKCSKQKVWEKPNRIYETYKNTVITHGRHIYPKEYDMARATMCAYLHSDNVLPHWKCALRCSAKCPNISLPEQ